MKTVLILSGGMDSATLLWFLLRAREMQDAEGEVLPMTFEYGSKHNARENEAASNLALLAQKRYGALCQDQVFVSLSFLGDLFGASSALLKKGNSIPQGHYAEENMKQTVVPNRNMIMLSLAVGLAESRGYKAVAFGNHTGDHAIYPDCRPEFVHALDAASRKGTFGQVEIHSPFAGFTKAMIVELGASLDVPYDMTYSCYEGHRIHCGKCGTCVERREAFYLAGVKDPTEYAVGWEETMRVGKLKV
jgi:7-cyano-7-deazaguanine synthase